MQYVCVCAVLHSVVLHVWFYTVLSHFQLQVTTTDTELSPSTKFPHTLSITTQSFPPFLSPGDHWSVLHFCNFISMLYKCNHIACNLWKLAPFHLAQLLWGNWQYKSMVPNVLKFSMTHIRVHINVYSVLKFKIFKMWIKCLWNPCCTTTEVGFWGTNFENW